MVKLISKLMGKMHRVVLEEERPPKQLPRREQGGRGRRQDEEPFGSPKKTGKFQLKVRLAGETVPKMYLSYGLNGHFIPKPKKKLNPFEKKLEEQHANLQLRQKRLAREKFANRDFGQSSPAMIAISGPGALPLKRRGSGMGEVPRQRWFTFTSLGRAERFRAERPRSVH